MADLFFLLFEFQFLLPEEEKVIQGKQKKEAPKGNPEFLWSPHIRSF